MAQLSIRVDLDASRRLGPGKVALLEQIDRHGSISAAGRAMAMSYRRAWMLVAEINDSFTEPLVSAQTGGRAGGGATLTDFGRDMVHAYRSIEREAEKAAGPYLDRIQAAARRVD